MDWVVGGGMLLGCLAIALGSIAVYSGWTPSWQRRRTTRPRVHGLGVLLVGTPCVLQGLFFFHLVPSPSWQVRFIGTNALLLSGLALITVGQMLPPSRSTTREHSPGPTA
ncbi:hypothetical protein [Streptomyces sp. NPDC054842]